MNQDQPQPTQSPQPVQQPAFQQPVTMADPAKTAANKKRGMMFLLLPFALFAFSFLLLIVSSMLRDNPSGVGDTVRAIINILIFATTGIAMIGFIPFIVIGIVYLIKK